MQSFIGCVVLESLSDQAALAGLSPLAERIASVPEDPDATTWHVQWFQLPGAELHSKLPELAAAMKPHWYAHFWSGDDLCVILAGKAFWASAADRSTWQEFIRYGDTVGVERRWTESIPTAVPDWVRPFLPANLA